MRVRTLSSSFEVFFVCFRECLETVIIVSILLSMLKQTLDPVSNPKTYKRLRKQVSLAPFLLQNGGEFDLEDNLVKVIAVGYDRLTLPT